MSDGTPKHTTPPPVRKGRGEVLLAEARLFEILISGMVKIKRENRRRSAKTRRNSTRPNRTAGLRHADDDAREPEVTDMTGGEASNLGHWLYGHHAVLAALRNPQRETDKLLCTAEGSTKLRSNIPDAMPEIVDREILEKLLPRGAVHQGIALSVRDLAPTALDQLLADAAANAFILVLDQVTDPQNVGAAVRNAAAFGATALILTTRRSTSAEATMAKAASGALETLPLARVTNLARALDQMKAAGFWCIGLADSAKERLESAPLDGRVALILGAEGSGLRRLTRTRCDMLVSLPTQPPMTSINIAAASAVALYEVARQRSNPAD